MLTLTVFGYDVSNNAASKQVHFVWQLFCLERNQFPAANCSTTCLLGTSKLNKLNIHVTKFQYPADFGALGRALLENNDAYSSRVYIFPKSNHMTVSEFIFHLHVENQIL
jgi:hypothetical protein